MTLDVLYGVRKCQSRHDFSSMSDASNGLISTAESDPISDAKAKWARRRSDCADSLAEKEGFEPSVPVHLCFALSGPEVAGVSAGFTISSAETMFASSSPKTLAMSKAVYEGDTG